MTALVALFMICLVAYVIVLCGAIAYELTGLDRETARFQALSAFTGTGFTTRQSEKVVLHPVRRRITSILIILGYAGLASVVATLMRSVEVESAGRQLLNGALVGGVAWGLFYLLRKRGFELDLTDLLRRFLAPRVSGEQVPHEELLLYARGYGVTRIEVPAGSRVAGMRLRELDLRALGLQVLAIEDHHEVQPVPDPDALLAVGQHLILYGRLDAVQGAFAPAVDAAP